ncbi:DUF454 family protein, partial [Enterococcus faecalis]|uniref:DUF454 family protein n=1 Tax=Enterococcus faecalis TaxID=1351 RepID=UPI003D6C5C29
MKKLFFIFLGSCTFALGTLGIFFPLFPTTGFYLFTAFFFVFRSYQPSHHLFSSSFF